MDILIKNATIVTNDPQRPVLKNSSVGVEDGIIVSVGKTGSSSADVVLQGDGKTLAPGLVNAHTHFHQALARGLEEDLALYPWLDKMWRFSRMLTSAEIYAATLLGAIEAVKSGSTSVITHQSHATDRQSVLKAVQAMNAVGLRAVFVRSSPRVLTKASEKMKNAGKLFKPPEEALKDSRVTEELMGEVNRSRGGLVKVWPGFPNVLTTDPDFILKSCEMAQRYGVGVHTHCSEDRSEPILYNKGYGLRPIEALYKMDVLSPMFHLAHCVWISKKEVQLLGKAGGCVVHNPVSNMYLADGVAPIPDLVKAGATIALGSDGPASNNTQDMFPVMKSAVLLQKVIHLNPSVMTAPQAFRMATSEGAKILGLEGKMGVINEGMKADMILVNMKKSHIQPVYREVSSLVYCCQGGDVESAIINGKVVMENGVLMNVDEVKTLDDIQRIANHLLKRVRRSERHN